MQWVFIALMVVIVSILVSVLQRVMAAVKNSYYIPPSEAVIDQSMPQEILEHIFSFMDPLTLLQSHNVSKYWRSHASKHRIKTIVLERYVNSIQRELPGIENHRLNYHESYPIDRRLSDIALAQKRGRDLLEMNAADSFWPKKRELDDLRTRYAIKLVTQIGYTSFPYLFNMGEKYLSMNNVTKKETESFIASYEGSIDLSVKYEVIVNLEDYCSTDTNANFIMCRNTKEKTKRFGIIPLDKSFLPAMIFLMIPLVVHDALYSEFLSVIKLWFGPIAFLVLNGITTQENLDAMRYCGNKRNVRLYKKLIISTSIASIIAFILLYPISSSHFAFIGIFVGATLYGYALYDQHFGEHWYQPKSKEKLHFFLICVTLVLLMNDWSMTIQSFIDGAIWQRLFWNMIHALFFTLYAIWISTMSAILHDDHKAWDWSFLINYDKQSIILISSFSISAVFVTLYAPYWERHY